MRGNKRASEASKRMYIVPRHQFVQDMCITSVQYYKFVKDIRLRHKILNYS